MKALFTAIILLAAVYARAQEVSFDHHVVSIDGKECLKIKGDVNNVSFVDMAGEELFFLKYNNSQRTGVRYCKVIFFKQHKQFTASNFMFTQKMFVRKLVAAGAIKDCALVDEKVEQFVLKFDENVVE